MTHTYDFCFRTPNNERNNSELHRLLKKSQAIYIAHDNFYYIWGISQKQFEQILDESWKDFEQHELNTLIIKRDELAEQVAEMSLEIKRRQCEALNVID